MNYRFDKEADYINTDSLKTFITLTGIILISTYGSIKVNI